mmetsp:Transcript_60709/g.140202  ORF Transcript_60709/g.140202 Transcript_60709/m.140202 type:complete len:334 (+) Transcript_60709:870-1871(+)
MRRLCLIALCVGAGDGLVELFGRLSPLLGKSRGCRRLRPGEPILRLQLLPVAGEHQSVAGGLQPLHSLVRGHVCLLGVALQLAEALLGPSTLQHRLGELTLQSVVQSPLVSVAHAHGFKLLRVAPPPSLHRLELRPGFPSLSAKLSHVGLQLPDSHLERIDTCGGLVGGLSCFRRFTSQGQYRRGRLIFRLAKGLLAGAQLALQGNHASLAAPKFAGGPSKRLLEVLHLRVLAFAGSLFVQELRGRHPLVIAEPRGGLHKRFGLEELALAGLLRSHLLLPVGRLQHLERFTHLHELVFTLLEHSTKLIPLQCGLELPELALVSRLVAGGTLDM